MEDIVCKSCGTINEYTVERKANNDVATCKACGHFIKNIPYQKPMFYFGKYAGKPIEEFSGKEIEYLYWVRNNPDLWPKLPKRLQDAIIKHLGLCRL